MDIFNRAKSILFSPSKEWEVIKNEKQSVGDMFMQYVLVVAAIPPVCGIIGNLFFGYSAALNYNPYGRGLTPAVVAYVLSIVGVFILGLAVDTLAPHFGSTKDTASSFKVAVFSLTASWVGGIFLLIPGLSILASLAGFYSFYLMYTGLRAVKNPPKEKLIAYFVTILVVYIAISVIIGIFISMALIGHHVRPSI